MTLSSVFSSMAGGRLMIPCLVVLPAIYAILLGIGWTREDIIEDSVYKIWSKTSGDYYKNREYAQDLGVEGSSSNFLAMATSRDSKNILTKERLEEIRSRMEAVETVKVVYKNNIFEWKDICAQNNIGLGTVYKFPCARLTPMDFFEESKWFVTEVDRVSWYNKGIQSNIVTPRIGRFGMMPKQCYTDNECKPLMEARADDPLKLFSDMTQMELNHPCRKCIENKYDQTIKNMTAAAKPLFKKMYFDLSETYATLTDGTEKTEFAKIIEKVKGIIPKIDRGAIEDFFKYYVTRELYAFIGYPNYLKVVSSGSKDDLYNHADNPFDSSNTMGLAYPGVEFGGSGINLNGVILSMKEYLTNTSIARARIDDPEWKTFVDNDPMYKWFMAGETNKVAHCGNDDLPGHFSGFTQRGCTKYSLPLEDENRTEQHFAKMWYNLLIDSGNFLDITQGESDPYTWTNGEGCGYKLKGMRGSYSGQNETTILMTVSKSNLYYLDEGASVGAIDKSLLMGGTFPSHNSVSSQNPYEKVSTIQTIYPALHSRLIPTRVQNCNRPLGAINITEADATAVLELFKIAMEDTWSEGWNNESATEVQFVCFSDDAGASGTFANVLRDITTDNGKLTAISIILIAVVSVIFLASNSIESRILVTLVGVLLVILSFFGALGFAILVGIKININIAWTLPFIMIGLGVDDMYIVLLALKQQKGYTKENFVAAMKEIIMPVFMTSLVNASMFATMNIVDIGAVYKTAQAALISVVFLFLTIIFCFPAYCYLDMKRQMAGQYDVLVCIKSKGSNNVSEDKSCLFAKFHKFLLLGGGWLSFMVQTVIVLSTVALLAVGIYGITERKFGLGLKEFFPSTHQASQWAGIREKDLASWPISVRWGALDYSSPDVQMKMIKQYEDIVSTPHVSSVGTDTNKLWIGSFNLWTTLQCGSNFVRADPNVLECGNDQIFVDSSASDSNTKCTGTWKRNIYGLLDKTFTDTNYTDKNTDKTSGVCQASKSGICRPASQMFPEDLEGFTPDNTDTTYCPVFEGWSDAKFKFCLEKWRQHTGGGGGLLLEKNTATPYTGLGPGCAGEYYSDDTIQFPIKISSSPSFFANELISHETTLDMIKETREVCDDKGGIHSCWMTGIPFDYWSQYDSVDSVLVQTVCTSIAVGFAVAALFLFIQLIIADDGHSSSTMIIASLAGAMLISLTSILCVIPVIGISVLAGVNLTAFSNMAFVLSIGFAVEYSVHVVHRFLSAPSSITSAQERVIYTMQFLTKPLTLSFLSSTIGIMCLAFTSFKFNEIFFFRPLIIVMLVTYFIGVFFLPILLTKLNFHFLRVGSSTSASDKWDDNA